MSGLYIPPPSPHTHTRGSVSAVMLQVWLALLPATLYAVGLFGWPALNLLLITVISALAAEAFSARLLGQPVGRVLGDGSALLTAWLLAMSLPPWAPWWLAVVGGLFAIILGKQVFGGIGQNIFNPAMLARVALLIAFPLEMTTWVAPQPLWGPDSLSFGEALGVTFGSTGYDSLTGATVLGHIKTELGRGVELGVALQGSYSDNSAMFGNMLGSLGETSALLLLLGGAFLLARRIITWHIPLAMLGSVTVLAGTFHLIDPSRYADPLVHLLSGGMILGAFFIATDPVGSPSTPRGQLVFGIGCGVLVYVIRTWGGFPEGVAFAVLLMNAAAPLIDHYLRPRIYGRDRSGQPLTYQQGSAAKRLQRLQTRSHTETENKEGQS